MKTIIKSLLVLMLFAVSEAASAIAVTIQDKEVAILNITSESVTINWKKAVRTDSQKAPLYYRVIWQQRTSGALSLPYPQDASPKMADADTYTMRHNIYPNTTYDVWIQVRDSYDGKEYLEYKSFSFTTKKSDYNAPSIKEEYSSTYLNMALNNSLNISVHYAYEPETMQASAHFDYVILYKKSSETTYKKHSCIGKNKSGAMNYYIDNLEQNTEYDILPVVTKDGKSNYYDVLTVSTANIDDVKPTITNYAVYVSGVTTNSATLKWTLATDNMTSKNDLVYHIYLMRPGQSPEKEYTVTGGNDSYTITGLQPGTAYVVNLKVTDNANNWSFYDSSDFTTKAPDTTAPTVSNKKYTVENKTYDSFTIRWTKGTDDVTPASDIKYTVCIVKASEYNGISWPVAASSLYDVDSYTFTNLESGETYLVKVWAYDAAGNRLEYETAEITTLSLDKNAPFASNKDLTITNVTSDGFTINWTPAEDDVTPASELQYFVCFDKLSDYGSGSDGITVIEKLKGDTSYTFTGLDPEEEYIIYITVLDAAGNWFGYNVLWNVKINNITPVESVKTDKVMNNGKMYSTAGVEVGNDYRGVVIINGKKYFKNK